MTYDHTHGPADERADHGLDALLGEMRRSYNVPPAAPPLDDMWGRIERERFGARFAQRGSRMPWWIGIAAALVAGVGIGRMTTSLPATATGDPPPSGTVAPQTAAAYDRTTARYLGQTAALLIALPTEARAGRAADHRVVGRAAELLTTTRLLLDSPAATDPKARALLEDLELVLAQVARIASERGGVELELITQALEQRDLLPRIHSAVAGNSEADD